MNKEDLIKKYESLEGVWDANGAEIARQCFLRDLEQLNEIDTKKVTVPQYVADWYEEHKDNLEYNIWDYVFMFEKQEETSFKKWFNNSKTKPFQTLVNMHQFGYEVEKEKRYLVKIKGMTNGCNYLNYRKIIDEWYLARDSEPLDYRTRHTRKELEEAGWGWVFDCPGVEVEEVEG